MTALFQEQGREDMKKLPLHNKNGIIPADFLL